MKVVSSCLVLGLIVGALTACEKSPPPTPVAVDRPNSSLAGNVGSLSNASAINGSLNNPSTTTGAGMGGASSASDMHVSRNSLDWGGVYKGTPVCANCENVEYVFELKDDSKYTLTYVDPDTSDQVKYDGDFKWDETGNSIGVNIDGHNYVYRVTENGLVRQATDAPADAKLVAPLQYKKSN